MGTVKIRIESVYGEKRCYPVDETAKTFAEIAGTKSLTTHTMALIERLGYEIKVETPRGMI